MDSNKIGEYIQLKRKEVGLTQSQLGDLLGVTSKAVSKWETGVAIPDVALFSSLTKALNITIEELLQGKDNEITPIRKKKISMTTILTIIIFLLIILSCSLVMYFKNNYSKVEIYKIESANNNFYVEGNLMNIDGKSYLSITDVDYVGDEINSLMSVHNFDYELYYKDDLLYRSSDYEKLRNSSEQTFVDQLSLISCFLNVSLSDDNIYNYSFLKLKIKYLDSYSNDRYIEVLLNFNSR